MLKQAQAAWQRWRDRRAAQRHAIPDPLWQLTLARYPFLSWRAPEHVQRLRLLTTLFLARKEFTGAHGLTVTDEMAVAIAAQAVLPLLHQQAEWALYDSFVGIVVHRDVVVAPRVVTDESGVVHEYDEELAGEAMSDGPVMLSWQDVTATADDSSTTGWAYNVTIHEFAHIIDLADGRADGMPPLPDRASRQHWLKVMTSAYADFCHQVDTQQPTAIDPYAAESIDEFFAVAVETFYVQPRTLQQTLPAVHRLFVDYFQEDPARHAA